MCEHTHAAPHMWFVPITIGGTDYAVTVQHVQNGYLGEAASNVCVCVHVCVCGCAHVCACSVCLYVTAVYMCVSV